MWRHALSVPSWISERVGTSAHSHALLLAWDSAFAFVDELPGPPDFRATLAAAVMPCTAQAAGTRLKPGETGTLAGSMRCTPWIGNKFPLNSHGGKFIAKETATDMPRWSGATINV